MDLSDTIKYLKDIGVVIPTTHSLSFNVFDSDAE